MEKYALLRFIFMCKTLIISYLCDPQLTTPLRYHFPSFRFWQTKGPPLSPWQPLVPISNVSLAHIIRSVIVVPGFPRESSSSFFWHCWLVTTFKIPCCNSYTDSPGYFAFPQPFCEKWKVFKKLSYEPVVSHKIFTKSLYISFIIY